MAKCLTSFEMHDMYFKTLHCEIYIKSINKAKQQ